MSEMCVEEEVQLGTAGDHRLAGVGLAGGCKQGRCLLVLLLLTSLFGEGRLRCDQQVTSLREGFPAAIHPFVSTSKKKHH